MLSEVIQYVIFFIFIPTVEGEMDFVDNIDRGGTSSTLLNVSISLVFSIRYATTTSLQGVLYIKST